MNTGDNAVWKTSLVSVVTVSVETAMRVSGLGHTYIHELIRNGSIASKKVGKRRLIDYQSLRSFLTMPDATEWSAK